MRIAKDGSIGWRAGAGAPMRPAVFAAMLACGLAGGCDNAGQGALSGGTIGALSGLAIGSLSGNAGAGAAIGAIAGGLGGAVIGDQNQRRSQGR